MAKSKKQEEIVEDAELVSQQAGDSSDGDFVPETQPVIVVEADEDFQMSSEDHRKKILECVNNLQNNFIDICKLLFQAQKLRRYETWGYSSFKEYAHRELGFKYSKAKALSALWMHIGSKDPQMFDELMTVGWDKANEISRVVNKENIQTWVDKAKHLNADDLKAEVRKYILSLVPKDAEEALKMESETREKAPEVVERQLHYKNFGLTYENYQTVNQAIVDVRRDNPEIQSEAEALAMVCADFLAGQNPDTHSKESTVALISTLSDKHGLAVVLLDKAENQILLGKEALEDLIKEALS